MSQNDLPDTFDIKVNGQPHQVFMSYGLLDELVRVTGSAERAAIAVFDSELRAEVLRLLLAGRGPSGRVLEPVDLADAGLDRRQVMDLLAWASGHVADFFVEAATRVAATVQRHRTELAALESLFAGSPASAGSAPFAGLSTAPPAGSA